jgi:DNA-3-methyladenine glycosylase I
VLDGAQAGLSWQTILRKREAYRAAFDQFDPEKVAGYGAAQIKRLLANEGIVRNRMKIESAIRNARAFLIVQKEFGTFDKYIWGFVGGEPIINRRRSISEVPATSPISDALSKDLKQRGFTFVGTTICFAMMQAIGMVNDHLTSCFRYDALAGKSRRK